MYYGIRTLCLSVLVLKQKTLIVAKLNNKFNVGQSTYITKQLLITINTTNCINYTIYIRGYVFQSIHVLLQAVSIYMKTKITLRICVLLRYYAACNSNSVPTFRDNLPAPFQGSGNPITWPFKIGPIGCPETSVRNYHYTLRNSPGKRRSHLLLGGSLKSRKITLTVTILWS